LVLLLVLVLTKRLFGVFAFDINTIIHVKWTKKKSFLTSTGHRA
jgi:hypothetical protein